MKITALVWNSHAEALAKAAETLPWLTLRLYPAKTLEQHPEKAGQALADMRSSQAVFLYRATEAFWEELEPELRVIAADRPVVCLSYDPSLWALSSVGRSCCRTPTGP